MKTAVTGAAGFIGTNLVNLLVENGHEVIAIDRVVPASAETREAVTWVSGDVLDLDSMTKALEGVEVVYHLVAVITLKHEDELCWRINTEGARTVAQAALTVGARRMVHCSSIDSYSNSVATIDEKSPRSTGADLPVYQRSKWGGEGAIRETIESGLDAVICNPTGVYGPVDLPNLSRINQLLFDSARGRLPGMVNSQYDLVDARDVAAGLYLAGEKGRTGENYLLGGHMGSLLQVCRLAARRVGKRGPRFALPMGLLNAAIPVIEPIGKLLKNDALSRAAFNKLTVSPAVDITKARTELGYDPRSTETTVNEFVDFLLGSGRL
ncbi:NAD-dependent epimerase/dehydratase family protein [Mycobacteroides abscessus]|uniref:NAD-dependent epimerase/dehydratase family protein n=1 Tax=Mycobacteroides abscessus TaxID=36809 RepID=UPI00078DF86A|nr:NAD-dependent epimerase/dehydratase family protein [Mycobacteroides abscessus]AMU19968.1 epimerase [Mycobacteroides abscessus]SHZ14874.1 NAD-dependent epimerase/dehydratase [Mycobacteroides abscessus subsp. bolletii]SHZ59629.1 NAD-dependent epimerase/dehydratase [Mycobacteroides abscessus subsp. bolletii]